MSDVTLTIKMKTLKELALEAVDEQFIEYIRTASTAVLNAQAYKLDIRQAIQKFADELPCLVDIHKALVDCVNQQDLT